MLGIGLSLTSVPTIDGGGGGILSLLNSAPVYIPNRFSAIPARGNITGAFTRAGVKNVPDFEGRQYQALSGERCFWHVRRVRNLIQTTSEDFSNAAWAKINGGTGSVPVVTSGFTDPNGGSTAYRLQANANGGGAGDYSVLRMTLAASATCRAVWVKSNTGSSQQIYCGEDSVGQVVTATTAWQRLSPPNSASDIRFDMGSYGFVGNTTQNVDVLIWRAQAEDVTGQSVQTASEYVSVGVASAPYYHGSMVDSVRCFGTDYSGNPLPTSESATYPMRGAWDETAATQLIATTADIRDMTTASWTLGATLTRARTSVGIDGAANSATRLTGGATAATNTITYTLTAAASSRTYSVRIKRITGTGPIRLTQDNFATNSDISSQLVSGRWVQVSITQSQLNAVFGIKVDTNGDAIDVDENQFEAGASGSSPILTGGATRPADVMTYTGADVSPIKAMACTFWRPVGVSAAGYIASITDGTANNTNQFYLNNATQHGMAGVTGGVVQWGGNSSNAYVPGTQMKCADSVATNDAKSDFAGVAQAADTSVTVPVVSQINVANLNGTLQLNGATADLYFWHRNLSQSELGAVDHP